MQAIRTKNYQDYNHTLRIFSGFQRKCPNKTQVHVLVEIGIAKNDSYSIEIGLFVFLILTEEITDG